MTFWAWLKSEVAAVVAPRPKTFLPDAALFKAIGAGEDRNALRIVENLEKQLGRDVAIGAFLRGLDDLCQRGFVTWYELPGGPQRGYRNRRFYMLTSTGLAAYSASLRDEPA